MNTLNPWETRFQSWKPRPPSARIRARLFGRETESSETNTLGRLAAWRQLHRALGIPGWNWLASAVGCLLVLAAVSGGRPGEPVNSSEARARRFLGRNTLSDQEGITYYTAAEHSGRNSWATPIFGWTNNARS